MTEHFSQESKTSFVKTGRMAELVVMTKDITNDMICNYFYFWFVFTTVTVIIGALMYLPIIPHSPMIGMIGMLMSILVGMVMALQPLAMYILCKRGLKNPAVAPPPPSA